MTTNSENAVLFGLAFMLCALVLNTASLAQTRPSRDAELKQISQLVQQDRNAEALAKLDALITAYPDDPKLKELRAELTPGGSPASGQSSAPQRVFPQAPATQPAVSTNTLLTIRITRLDLADAANAAKAGQATKVMELTEHARDEIQPILADPIQATLEAWRLGGVIAVTLNDADLAARSAAAIQKMKPDFAHDDNLLTLVAELRRIAPASAQPSDTTTDKTAAGQGNAITNSIRMTFVKIAPGTFVMGSPRNEAGHEDDETPQHRVTLTRGFYMATTPVTQAQWKTVMGNNPSHFQGNDLPVEQVSWNDATDFCNKLSQKEGKHYRLPTEAEWEYACRAGTTAAYYSGDAEAALAEDGWYNANSNQQTHPVGQKKPNAWGLYDMLGNVWQWCGDKYANNYYSNGDMTDPPGPTDGEARALRGGSWRTYPLNCRSASRNNFAPDLRYLYIGFRLVLDSE